jgi:hypothetical protein
MRPVPSVLTRALSLAAILGAACAPPKPVVVPERAPPAARPSLLGIYHSTQRPTRLDPTLGLGEVKELRPCPFDPRVAELPAGGGILLRIQAPVPTDLRLQLDTSQGQMLIPSPEDPSDEERLLRRGSGYFYENQEITRQAPSGSVVPRELAISPGPLAGGDRRVDLSVRTLSFDPQATGPDRESQPLYLALVGTCPDVAVNLSRDSLSLQPGQLRRMFVSLEPKGDGVRQMKTVLSVEGLPAGVKATVKDPLVAEANWSNKRETAVDFEVAKDAAQATAKITFKVVLAAIERRATLSFTVLPKPE